MPSGRVLIFSVCSLVRPPRRRRRSASASGSSSSAPADPSSAMWASTVRRTTVERSRSDTSSSLIVGTVGTRPKRPVPFSNGPLPSRRSVASWQRAPPTTRHPFARSSGSDSSEPVKRTARSGGATAATSTSCDQVRCTSAPWRGDVVPWTTTACSTAVVEAVSSKEGFRTSGDDGWRPRALPWIHIERCALDHVMPRGGVHAGFPCVLSTVGHAPTGRAGVRDSGSW